MRNRRKELQYHPPSNVTELCNVNALRVQLGGQLLLCLQEEARHEIAREFEAVQQMPEGGRMAHHIVNDFAPFLTSQQGGGE